MTAAERAWSELQRVEALAIDDEIVAATLKNPGIMCGRVLDRAFETQPPSRAAQVVATLRNRFDKQPHAYPIGDGPLEVLSLRVRNELAIATASAIAAHEDTYWQLSFPYANALADACSLWAQRGEYELASTVGGLLVASADALHASDPEDREGLVVRWIAWLSRIDVVKMIVMQTADGALLEETEAGALGLVRGTDAPSESMLGDLMFRLGTLYLDPWLVGRDPRNYDRAIDDWRRLAVNRALGEEVALVPTAAEAFRKSEIALRRSLTLVREALRGKALKALVQLLSFRARVLAETIDHAELVALAREALPLVEDSGDAEPREFLRAVLEAEGQGASFDDTAWENEAVGAHRRADLAIMAITWATAKDPVRASDIFVRCRELFEQVGDETLSVQRWTLGLDAFATVHRAGAPHRFDVEAGVIARALETGSNNQELAVLAELSQLVRERDVSAIEDLLLYATLLLRRGAGVNATKAGDFGESVAEFATGLAVAVALQLPQAATSLLDAIRDAVIEDGTYRAGLVALRVTSPRLPDLEQLLGERAQLLAWELGKHAMAKLARSPAPPDAHLMAHQLVKGVRFGAAVIAGARLDTSAAIDPGATLRASADRGLSDEWIMAGFARADSRLAGDSDAVRAANRRLQLDTQIRSTWGRHAPLPAAPSVAELQRDLPDDVAVLSLYIGRDHLGNASLFSLGITKESVVPSVTQTNFEGALTILEDRETGQRAIQSTLATLVAGAREAIRESPPRVALNDEGVAAMSPIAGMLKGALHFLSECERAHKKRLLLASHGALHFFPFHLLGDRAAPLAERWQITHVPSLLALSRRSPELRERSLCALGLDYVADASNPHGLPMLAASPEEATECAKAFGTEPFLDAAAVPARLHEGLAAARYVHFSGHGEIDVIAPAFQTLFFAPDGDRDGRVFAHELMARSFAGCELVSLSACESGLGRFDLADNLMGISAALLSGGVRYVIATLWEVSDASARLFFRTLYEALHRGASCHGAFDLARQATRTRYPAYRDWGAFIIMGHEGGEK